MPLDLFLNTTSATDPGGNGTVNSTVNNCTVNVNRYK